MHQILRIPILLFLLFTFSCARPTGGSTKRVALHAFKTQTVETLVATMGSPDQVVKPEATSATELHVYKEKHFQVEGDEVTTSHRIPRGEEVYLQYWLQKLQGYECKWQDSKDDPKADVKNTQRQYVCAEDGLTLLYDSSADKVIRVVEYESH